MGLESVLLGVNVSRFGGSKTFFLFKTYNLALQWSDPNYQSILHIFGNAALFQTYLEHKYHNNIPSHRAYTDNVRRFDHIEKFQLRLESRYTLFYKKTPINKNKTKNILINKVLHTFTFCFGRAPIIKRALVTISATSSF